MRQAPLGHDRAAARDDAGDAVGGEMDVSESHAGMDGEIIDALLALLDQGVLVALPVELDGIAVDLFERLIDRHGADRHRRIAQDPFAGVVDVAAGGEVHHGVGAPADRPHHFLHFLLHGRRDGGVADIGIYFREKVPPDDHRLELAVIDVGRDDGAAARHFRAHEFRGDEERHFGAEAFAVVMAFLRDVEHCLPPEIFALGDVDHFLGDDALARPFELGDGRVADSAHRPRCVGEIAGEMLAGDVAVVDRLDRAAVVLFDAAALLHPLNARARKALLDVDRRVGLGIDAGGVIDPHRLLAGTLRQRNLAQRHAQLGRRVGRRVNFREPAIGPVVTVGVARSASERGLFIAAFLLRSLSCERSGDGEVGAGFRRSFRPFAGMTRIRFKGFFSAQNRAPLGTPVI